MREQLEHALRRDGDGYHARSHAGIGTITDPVFAQLELIHRVRPITSVLEIGCTTGFRLARARTAFGATCAGLEVAPAAVAEGRERYPDVDLREGVAPRDLEHWAATTFDVVVVGHFLYLLPREEVFALAAAVDRLVVDGGHLVVMDFLSPTPTSAPYAHHADLRVFKHDPSLPWQWSPTYFLVSRQVYEIAENPVAAQDPRAWQTVDVLRKLSSDEAYPQAATLPSVHEPRDAV